MGMELMARYSIPPDQRPGPALGADLIGGRGPDDRIEMLVVHPDGNNWSICEGRAPRTMSTIRDRGGPSSTGFAWPR